METMTFRELTDQMVALYHQNKMEDALRLIEQNQASFPEQAARMVFWRMCLLSLTGRPAEVLSVFQRGLDAGWWWAEEMFADPDLNAVRDMPEFRRSSPFRRRNIRRHENTSNEIRSSCCRMPPALGNVPLLIALHGRNGNKESNLEYLQALSQKGWIVLAAQSTQPLFPGAYCWDDAAQGLADVLYYHKQALQRYPIDPQRVVIAGFSQGGGMAIRTAAQWNG